MISRTCLLLACCIALVHAQEAAPEPSPKTDRGCMWRVWVLPARDGQEVSFVARASASEPLQTLGVSKNGEQQITRGYAPAKPGSYQFGVLGADQSVLAREEAPLRGGSYYTVIAFQEGKDWKIRAFLDGPQPQGARPLRVFNFSRGREATLDIGQKQSAPAKVGPDGVSEFSAPASVTGITVNVLARDGGAPAKSSFEVDFVSVPSAYIVIAPDYRDRMRPQTIEGGPRVESAADAAP